MYCLLRFLFMGSAPSFSRSLPVRPASLSFFCVSCLVSVPAFVLFSCTVSSSSSPQFFGSVFLFCSFESFGSFVSFFVPVRLFPVFVFHTSSSILLLGYSFVRALRACVVFVFGCIGVLFVLPCSPSPPRGLGSAFPPCYSVFLAVLRRPVVPLSSPFISPSSAFLEWFWLRFRFLFLYHSVSVPSDFLLAFCLLPAPSSVLSPLGLVGVRLWVCAHSSVAPLLPLPLYFVSDVLPFFRGLVSCLLCFLFLLCVLCFWFSCLVS